jgi:uncharacterized membrane protein YcaP (DUF421 family)
LTHRALSLLKHRHRRLSMIIDGPSLILLKDGQWQTDTMQHMRVHQTDVMASARGAGMKTADQIKCAVLERNGSITTIKADIGS